MEGDKRLNDLRQCINYFNPLPPHGGRQPLPGSHGGEKQISIHSLRMEGDATFPFVFTYPRKFQSTPSAWRETFTISSVWSVLRNFNPLPPHGGRLAEWGVNMRNKAFQSTPSAWRETQRMDICATWEFISIHSLRMEGDAVQACVRGVLLFISIHSLRMEGDDDKQLRVPSMTLFQSTPSAWRETSTVQSMYFFTSFQSTPSAWRETVQTGTSGQGCVISIHSLRMEGDLRYAKQREDIRQISIHSLRMEGDHCRYWTRTSRQHFNPLPPHGGRHMLHIHHY